MSRSTNAASAVADVSFLGRRARSTSHSCVIILDHPTAVAAHGVNEFLFWKTEKMKKMMEKTEMLGKRGDEDDLD